MTLLMTCLLSIFKVNLNCNFQNKIIKFFIFQLQQNSTNSTLNGRLDSANPIILAYLICGGILVAGSFWFFLLNFIHLEKNIRKEMRSSIETRIETPIKELLVFFSLISLYMFTCVAGEVTYSSFIYSVSICSRLRFQVRKDCGVLFLLEGFL